jgi:alpha-mannosidase
LEFAASWAYVSGGGYTYPAEELALIWQEVLLYQFHDILPGSSITRVYTESLERYAILLPRVQELTADAYRHVAKAAGLAGGTRVLFNSLPWEREQGVEQDGSGTSCRISLPAMGYRVVDTAGASAAAEQAGQAAAVLRATEHELENEALHVRFHADGSLASVYDKIAGREVLAQEARGNVLAVYHDNGDAWDFPRDYREMPAGAFTLTAASAAVVGAQAILTHDYRYGDSTLKQRIILAAGEDTLRFETEADWRENAKMLRASFPLGVQAEVAQCDIQFGYLKRATTRNTREEFARDEICAHHYIDLSQPDYGVSLLNDCKYGFSAATNSLDIHLLRAPHYPDPTADRAKHTFVYALYPHQGDAVQALTYRKGYELNVSPVEVTLPAADATTLSDSALAEPAADHHAMPVDLPLSLGARKPGRSMTFAKLDHAQVMIEAIKKAEDSPHLILRLYETAGMTTQTRLSLGIECLSAEETDLMEQPLQPLNMVKVDGKDTVELAFKPFEIKTMRIMPANV